MSSSPCPLLHLSCYLKLCGRSGRNCPSSPPVLSGYNGFPDTRFSRGTTRPMSWPDGERYLRPPQSLVVSLLLSLVSTLVFCRTGGVLSHQSILTRVPSISTEELVLPRHARCVLSRLRCNGHSLLLCSYLPRIGRIENPSCSACGHSSQDISHLILHCLATDSLRRSLFGDSLSLRPLVPDPVELSSFWGSVVICHAPIPRKESGNQQQQQQRERERQERKRHTTDLRESACCTTVVQRVALQKMFGVGRAQGIWDPRRG